MAVILVVTSAPPLVEGGHLVIARSLLQALVDAGVRVSRFAPTRKSLDDIFVEVYGADASGED